MVDQPKKTLLIVDGHAVLHRAWHALPPLTTSAGVPTQGAYGFTMTLLNAIRRFSPSHIVVTFDLKGPTFRHQAYDAYKATREKKPDEFYAQMPLAEKVLKAMDVPVLTAPGFEADDVIATVATRAVKEDRDLRVIIATGDLDTLQLVDDNVRVFTMRKGLADTVLYDADAVRRRYALEPSQMVDYKALRGDPSDNIPGVKGIGEVTAAELLGKFGTLDKLYQAIETDEPRARELRPSVVEKLKTHKQDAYLARDLCRLRHDAPVDFSLKTSEFREITQAKVQSVFDELQFQRLLSQLPAGQATAERADVKPVELKSPASPTGQTAAAETLPLFPAEPAMKPASTSAAKVRAPYPQLPALKPITPAEEAKLSKLQDVTMVADAKSLAACLEKLQAAKRVAFRTVTQAEDPATPAVLALGLTDGKHAYVVGQTVLVAAKIQLNEFFSAHPKRLLICHDLKREINNLASLGIGVERPYFDLLIAAYLFFSGERRSSFGSLLSFYRHVPPEIKRLTAGERVFRLVQELPHLIPLATELQAMLSKYRLKSLNDTIELPLAPVLAKMERAGFPVDVRYLRRLSKDFEVKLQGLAAKIYGYAGDKFNINSPTQLKAVLFEKLQLSVAGLKKTEKSRTLSTAAAELEKLRGSHPIIEAVLDYRELAKLQSTYVDALPAQVHPKTGRIHASFNQAVTATGRLSSSNPNLQNIPTPDTANGRLVRNGFVATKGFVLLAADYSQIELRIAAHIAGDKSMIRAFKKGEDVHWRTAVEMWGPAEADAKRRIAKVINFGILYGMGARRLAENTGLPLAEAEAYIDRYFSLHPGVVDYMDDMKEKVRKYGFVQTLFGRRRFFYNFDLMNHRDRAEAERQAINMPIQGTQADMTKLAMVRLNDRLAQKFGAGDDAPVRLLSQVHDELIFEVRQDLVPEAAAEIRPIMEKVVKLSVPIAVNLSVGERWGEMRKMQ